MTCLRCACSFQLEMTICIGAEGDSCVGLFMGGPVRRARGVRPC